MKCTKCNEEVKPVIAIDIDGTLADYHEHFTNFAEQWLGHVLPRGYDGGMEFNEFLGLDKRTSRDIKLAFRQGGQKRSMPTFPGAPLFMQTLKQNGFETWIATTRPWQRLDNIDPDTRHWLARNYMSYDAMVYGDNKWEQLIEAVGVERVVACVDDLPWQCETAEDMGIKAYQPIRKHNEEARFQRRQEAFNVILENVNNDLSRWESAHGED